MFDTSLFIHEVKQRPCLWNTKDSAHNSYNNRQLKNAAWQEIVNVFNTTCKDSPSHKNVTVDILQRKWKHVRDYYIREKKKTMKYDPNTGALTSVGRIRNSPLLDMLEFLDVNRDDKLNDIAEVTVASNDTDEHFYPEATEEEETGFEISNPRPTKLIRIELEQSNPLADDNEDDPEKQLLNSLLPVIKNMNARDKLKIRQMTNSATQESHNTIEENRRTSESRKRQRTHDAEETDTYKLTKNTEAMLKRDQFSIYGEYVANKLRNIRNAHARSTAEFRINGILYKAEMGEYDRGTRDVTTRSGSSRQSSNVVTNESLEYEEDDDSSDEILANVIKAEHLN